MGAAFRIDRNTAVCLCRLYVICGGLFLNLQSGFKFARLCNSEIGTIGIDSAGNIHFLLLKTVSIIA